MLDAFDRAVGWVVEKPLATTLLLLTITGVATLGYLDPQLVTELFRADPASIDTTTNAAEIFERCPMLTRSI